MEYGIDLPTGTIYINEMNKENNIMMTDCCNYEEFIENCKYVFENYDNVDRVIYDNSITSNHFEISKEKYNKIQSEEKYIIEIWKTEEDREMGESFEYLDEYDNQEQAIQTAKKIFDKNNYACVEVSKLPDNKAIYLIDSEEEQYYINNKTISYVNKEMLNKYIECWLNNKILPISNNLLYNFDENKHIAVDNSGGNCWVEEFETKDKAICWLLNLDKDNFEENEVNL